MLISVPPASRLSAAQAIQKLISTYSNDKLLRSKFSSPTQVKTFPVPAESCVCAHTRVGHRDNSDDGSACTDLAAWRQVCDPFGADSC